MVVKDIISPPTYTSYERTQKAAFLHIALVFIALSLILFGGLNISWGAFALGGTYLIFSGVCILGILLNKVKQFNIAAILLTTIVYIAFFYNLVDGAALHDPGIAALPILLVLTGFLFNRWSIPFFTAISIAGVYLVFVLWDLNLLELNQAPTINRVTILGILQILTGGMVWFVVTTFQKTIEKLNQSETALLERAERHRVFVEDSTAIIWHYEIQPPMPLDLPIEEQIEYLMHKSRLVETNDSMAKTLDLSVEEMLGMSLFENWGSQDLLGKVILKDYIDQGYKLEMYETPEHDPRGRLIWVIHNASSVIENNQLIRIWGTSLEITQRKQAEEALKESELRYRTLFQNANDAIFITEGDNIIDLNLSTVKMFGAKAEDIIGSSVFDFTPDFQPDGRNSKEIGFQYISNVEKGERQLFEWQHQHEDGSYFDTEISLNRIDLSEKNLILAIVRDISDRKAAEAALRQSENDLNIAQAIAKIGSYTWDMQSDRVAWSDEMRRLLWYEDEEPSYELFLKRIHPDDKEEVIAQVQQIRATTEPTELEYRLMGPDGSIRWVRDRIRVEMDDEGQPIQMLGTSQDITERKLAERAIKKTQRRYQALFDGSTDAVIILGLDDEFIDLNESAVDLLDYHSGDFSSLQLSQILEPEAYEDSAQKTEMLLRGEKVPPYERILIRQDGTRIPVEVNLTLVRDEVGNPQYFQSITRDITDRKRAESLLKESEIKFRALFENSGYAIGVSIDGIHTMVNPAYLKLFGYDHEDELLGKPIIDLIAPDERVFVMENVAKRRKGEAVPLYYETRGLLKNGSEFDMDVRVSPYALGDKTYTSVILRDISESKSAEENIRQRNRELALLYESSRIISQYLDPEMIGEKLIEAMEKLLGYEFGGVLVLDDLTQEIIPLALSDQGKGKDFVDQDKDYFSSKEMRIGDGIVGWVLQHGKPVRLGDVRQDSRYFSMRPDIRSELCVPMIAGNQIIGALNVETSKPDAYDENDQRLLTSLAGPAAVTIQNAQLLAETQKYADELEQRVFDRTQELSALYEVSAVASSSTDLETTLAQVTKIIIEAVEGDSGGIHLLDEENKNLILAYQQDVPQRTIEQRQVVPIGDSLLGKVLENGEPIYVSNALHEPGVSIRFTESYSWQGVPMRASGKDIGVFSILGKPGRPGFSEDEISLLTSMVEQAAAVVESARLRKQSEFAAALEERQRLARDLHDAVSQTLFSASVIAQTLERLWERDPELVRQNLVELERLTRGALAEMRNLLFELRPAALEQADMVELLQQLADGFTGRTHAKINLVFNDRNHLPFDVRAAFFRLAQEALNNIIKHARAQQAWINYFSEVGHARLVIKDDGRGFDLNNIQTGRLGLEIMQERAMAIGASLVIDSQPGEGTQVEITWHE
jgi:PAS domain S-box-containing protein